MMHTIEQPTPPAVVVTGASTGIGEACTLELVRQGYLVFAGVRREEDGTALLRKASQPELLSWLLLDITDTNSLEAAARTVAKTVSGSGLSGLVNNAGLAGIGPLEFLPLIELRKLLEVNVIGQMATIQTFLPLLRQAQGRIVNIGSISGQLALPFGGGYSISKFALEALTDELRIELRPWHIHVSLIEPGGISTPLWRKSIVMEKRLLEHLPEQALAYYGPIFPFLRSLAERWSKNGTPPSQVARVVVHALTAPHPKTRYFVGRRANLVARLLARLPDRVRDMLIMSQLPKYP